MVYPERKQISPLNAPFMHVWARYSCFWPRGPRFVGILTRPPPRLLLPSPLFRLRRRNTIFLFFQGAPTESPPLTQRLKNVCERISNARGESLIRSIELCQRRRELNWIYVFDDRRVLFPIVSISINVARAFRVPTNSLLIWRLSDGSDYK